MASPASHPCRFSKKATPRRLVSNSLVERARTGRELAADRIQVNAAQ
jgi:hypothetical protein